jgi:hypothetical protein
MTFWQFLVSIVPWETLVNPPWIWLCIAILCWKSPDLIRAMLGVLKWMHEKKSPRIPSRNKRKITKKPSC